jgi:E3 ubiquitin-protein ligase SHPRH
MFRYFRQLQEISDSVREEEWGDVDVEVALRKNRAAQAELERKINTGRARQRFVRSDSPQREMATL